MNTPKPNEQTASAVAVRSSDLLGDMEVFLAELAAPIEPGSDGYHERDLGKCRHWCIACRAKRLLDAKSSNVADQATASK